MIKKIVKSYDYSIITAYIILSLFGLIMVYSSSMVVSIKLYDQPADFFFQKQKVNLLIAFCAFLFFALFPYKAFRNKKFLVFITTASVFGLIILYFVGHTTNNAQSWIKLGIRNIQPSEFVKLSVILYLSAVYANKQKYIDKLNSGVLPPFIYLIFVCFLIKIEPDNGTAIITFLIGMTIILCSGMKFKTIAKLMGLGVAFLLLLSPFLYFKFEGIVTEGNMNRISGFLDPFGTADKEGFQLVNSYLAIGSGGLKGVGLGQSVQKYGYLPEAHTDFIMAIIAEELGLFGVGIVLIGLAYLVLRGIYTGIRCKDPFGSMLAIGISTMIGLQAFINLGGMSGIIPITGVTLPFISYGGSSILVLSAAIGLLVNISMFVNFDEKYKAKRENTTAPINTKSQPRYYRNHLQK